VNAKQCHCCSLVLDFSAVRRCGVRNSQLCRILRISDPRIRYPASGPNFAWLAGGKAGTGCASLGHWASIRTILGEFSRNSTNSPGGITPDKGWPWAAIVIKLRDVKTTTLRCRRWKGKGSCSVARNLGQLQLVYNTRWQPVRPKCMEGARILVTITIAAICDGKKNSWKVGICGCNLRFPRQIWSAALIRRPARWTLIRRLSLIMAEPEGCVASVNSRRQLPHAGVMITAYYTNELKQQIRDLVMCDDKPVSPLKTRKYTKPI